MITVGGRNTKTLSFCVPPSGCWELRVTYEGKPISGRVVVNWRGWQLLGGEVDTEQSDVFSGEPFAVIVGGLAWTQVLAPQSYQDDRGILTSTVMQPIAASLGETLILHENKPLGRYYMRRSESGGALLSRIYRVGQWHVGTDGKTRTGPRPQVNAGRSVTVLQHNPIERTATLYADRPDECLPGSVIAATDRNVKLLVTRLLVEVQGTTERIAARVEAL